MKRSTVLALCVLVLAACATTVPDQAGPPPEARPVEAPAATPAEAPVSPVDPAFLMLPFRGSVFIYTHLIADADVRSGQAVAPGRTIGRDEPLPEQLSPSSERDALLRISDELYQAKRYAEAADLLLSIEGEESGNVHYLYRLGMASFWAGTSEYKGISWRAFQSLFRLIDELTPHSTDEVVLDCWFVNAYAKLGMLHLDGRQYAQAVTQLSKALLLAPHAAPEVLDSWYSYLTEGYYGLGLSAPNWYFYGLAKQNNAGNTYVDDFLLDEGSDAAASGRLRSILDTLVKLPAKAELVTRLLGDAAEWSRTGALELRVDPFLPSTIYDGLELRWGAQGGSGVKPVLAVSPRVVDLYEREPSVVLSALVHELQHARDYFQTPEAFTQNAGNGLERFRYEMDATYIEALFARDTLAPAGYRLTAFERALVQSLEQDNLAAHAVFLRGVDMHLAYALDDGWGAVRSGSVAPETYLGQLADLGRRLDGMPLSDDPSRRYQELVSRSTYAGFAPVVLGYAAASFGLRFADATAFSDWIRASYPGISQGVESARAVVKQHAEEMRSYREGILRSLEP